MCVSSIQTTCVCVCVPYLSQCLYAGVDVPTGHLGDDKVYGGGRAVVELIVVGGDRAHPGEATHTYTLKANTS